MKRLFVLIVAVFSVSQIASAVPIYQVEDDDVIWTETGPSTGVFRAPISAHDGDNEIWEFPVKPGLTLLDIAPPDGTDDTMETTDLYHGYADLKHAKWGVGNRDIGLGFKDYLFLYWEVNTNSDIKFGSIDTGKELSAHYYFYTEPKGLPAFLVQVPGGKAEGLGATFAGGTNDIFLFEEENYTGEGAGEGDVPGDPDITVAPEGGVSFQSSLTEAVGRRVSSTVIEVAVALSDLYQGPLKSLGTPPVATLSSFIGIPVDYAYHGVAESNPSDPGTDIFANDRYHPDFAEAQTRSVEYDTLRAGNLVPEPATCWLALLGFGILVLRARRYSRL